MAIEGFIGEYDFGKLCSGVDPTGTIDVTGVTMSQEYSMTLGKTIFDISHAKIKNTGTYPDTDCKMWTAVEMRMWAGVHTTCPVGSQEPNWKGMNINVDEEWMIIFPVEVGATEEIYAHYLVPDAIKGIHTICLYVWADFSKNDLQYDLEVAGYTNPER